MSALPKIRAVFHRRNTDNALEIQPAAQTPNSPQDANERNLDEKAASVDEAAAAPNKDNIALQDRNDNLQDGVAAVEAVTLNWSKTSLIAVFVKYVTQSTRHSQEYSDC